MLRHHQNRSVLPEMVLKQSDNLNGSVQPPGLKGEKISLKCLLFSITIACSAMTGSWTRAETLPHDQALAELKHRAGSRFDPGLVEALVITIG